MSILYRALWQADADPLLATADREFRAWVTTKHPSLDLTDFSATQVGPMHTELGSVDVEVDQQSNDHGAIGRWVLHEDNLESRWITTVMAILARGDREGWVWIDVENVRTDYFSKIEIAAPNLAGNLLEALPSSHRGPITLQNASFVLGPSELPTFAERLIHPERDLPLIVFSHDDRADPGLSIGRAKMAAIRLAGLAQVYHLLPEGEQEFRELMGPDLGVWSGACRVYLPGINPEEPDSWRHRYFLSRRLGSKPIDAGLIVALYLSQRIARQRAPRSYVKLRDLLNVDHQSQISDLWIELERLDTENEQLRDRYLNAAVEADDLSKQVGRLIQQMDVIWAAISAAGVYGSVSAQFMEDGPKAGVTVPDPPEECAEVVQLANQYLRGIIFPTEACEDLDRLDGHLEGPKWANTAWRGVVALDKYAQEAWNFEGGFYEWCSSSGSAFAWSPKKLAMVESGTVRNTEKYRQPRMRPIDTRVESSGRMFMEAHLKIAEGGGRLAPRIYFYDDTAGVTGKIHIGFFGPHYLVPNASSN